MTEPLSSPVKSSSVPLSAGSAKPLLLALSFLGGFQIMALEICGFRVLQMNLGSSVVVTGTLLTLIMIVLSVGYYLGGSLERLHSPRALCVLLLASCVYTHFANVILLDRIGDLGLDLRDRLGGLDHIEVGLPAALLSALLYGPPVLAMSTISPCLIRLQSQSASADVGKSSGFIMSLSTAGSIFGTLLASYVLIPSFGIRATAAGTNAAFFGVVALALVSSARSGRRQAVAAASVGTAVLLSLVPVSRGELVHTLLSDSESMYGRVRVIEDKDEHGRTFRAFEPSIGYWHTVTYPEDPLRALPGVFYLAPALVEKSKSMLILGSAAGGAIRVAQTLMPELAVTGVDIDPAVHEIATKYFGVDASKVRFVSRDARQFLERERQRYDYIVVDTFAGEFIPAHCATREFFTRVRQHLNPGGVVFVNTNMYDVPFELPPGEREPARVNRHLERSLREAGFPSIFVNNFFHSTVLHTTPQSIDAYRARLRALAADDQQPLAARAALGLLARTTVEAASYAREYVPFTDAWAPEIVLELKSNHAKLFDALLEAKSEPTPVPLHPAVRIIRDRLLAERAEGAYSGAIGDAAALVRELNRVSGPLTAADRELAARYLRFEASEPLELNPKTPWAQLAATYARLFAAGNTNDYERLVGVLGELDRSWAEPG